MFLEKSLSFSNPNRVSIYMHVEEVLACAKTQVQRYFGLNLLEATGKARGTNGRALEHVVNLDLECHPAKGNINPGGLRCSYHSVIYSMYNPHRDHFLGLIPLIQRFHDALKSRPAVFTGRPLPNSRGK